MTSVTLFFVDKWGVIFQETAWLKIALAFYPDGNYEEERSGTCGRFESVQFT